MSTRFAKQMIYGTFYVVVWVLVIWGGYSLFGPKTTSCFDKVQDRGELGVDCGGPCSTVCGPSVQPVSVLSVNTFMLPGGHDTFLAKIANPNADFAAQSFSYAFNAYDASGTLLQSYPGQSFLFSQQIKYLVLANEAVPSEAVREDITITNPNWAAASTLGAVPQLTVQNVATRIASTSVVVSGQLADNDTATFNNIFIVAVFKDANGNPIAASQTLLDSITPNQTENFSVTYPVISGINPVLTEVNAYAVKG